MKTVIAALSILALAQPAYAQNALESRCPSGSFNEFCTRMGEAAEVAQVRSGIALSGGNPVMGASSTLGIRLGAIPRITVAGRFTAARLETQDVREPSQRDINGFARSLNLDAAVGVFSGLSLLPTVGGFGSVDVLASFGRLTLPDEFLQSDINSWGLGVRLGVLRESFTAPGVAVTGMYRRIGDIQHGSTFGPADGPGTHFILTDGSALSARATVGKRLLMLGAVAGVGYDRYSATAKAQDAQNFSITADDFTSSRTTVFGSLSWTMLILHVIGEGGIQQGGDENAFYGSFAVRLAL